jgi:hypothetical protein
MKRKCILFLLTKDFFESYKFRKLFREATRLKKKIYLIKLEEFDFDVGNYENVFDISRHEECKYEGYLTRKLVRELPENCSASVRVECVNLVVNLYFNVFL